MHRGPPASCEEPSPYWYTWHGTKTSRNPYIRVEYHAHHLLKFLLHPECIRSRLSPECMQTMERGHERKSTTCCLLSLRSCYLSYPDRDPIKRCCSARMVSHQYACVFEVSKSAGSKEQIEIWEYRLTARRSSQNLPIIVSVASRIDRGRQAMLLDCCWFARNSFLRNEPLAYGTPNRLKGSVIAGQHTMEGSHPTCTYARIQLTAALLN